MVSRMPPASPAATMFTYSSVNTLGCLRMESASVCPASMSCSTSEMIAWNFLFSVCSARMERLCTSGSPALIMVANCRVKITTSRVLTPEPNEKLISFGLERTDTGRRRCRTSQPNTSSLVGRLISPLVSSPATERAL